MSVALVCLAFAGAQAQQGARAPSAPMSPVPAAAAQPALAARAQRTPQSALSAPQVITVIHRLSGWKLLVWISRNSAQQVTGFDYQLLTDQRAHTNIVAGYVLGDGRTVVARLPQAEAEIEPVVAPPELRANGTGESEQHSEFLIVRHDGSQVKAIFVGLDARTGLSVLRTEEPLFVASPAPCAPNPCGAGGRVRGSAASGVGFNAGYAAGLRVRLYAPAPDTSRAAYTVGAMQTATSVQVAPRRPPPARIVPGQAVTSSSQTAVAPRPAEPTTTTTTTAPTPVAPAAAAAAPPPGQAPRVIQRTEVHTTTVAPQTAGTPRGAGAPVGDEGFIYMRLAETEGRLTQMRRPLPEAARLSVRAEGLNPTYAGAVALAESGEFIGIVERLYGNEARLVPSRAARSAAERVLAQRASIPQAWLGASGSAVAPSQTFIPLLVRHGWSAEQARAVARLQQGVLLTAIVPGAPAALAGLRPGDIVTRIGTTPVRTIEDVSRLIRAAGVGAELPFTVVRMEQSEPDEILVRLGESLNPRRATEVALVRNAPRASSHMSAARVARPAGAHVFTLPPGALGVGLESIVLTGVHAARFERPSVMIVLTVRPESAAHRIGLRPGDVILSINDEPLDQTEWREKFSMVTAAGINLEVRRGDQLIRLSGSAGSSGGRTP